MIRRRALRKGDILVLGKGFYSYLNYVESIARFKIVPMIFPRKNFDLDRVLGMVSYPLEVFNGRAAYVEEKKRFYDRWYWSSKRRSRGGKISSP